MSHENHVEYGPLERLIGVWKGDKGLDLSPEPDGSEASPYHETIVYSAVGTVTNAESQTLSAVHYRQVVRRQSTNEVFHDETGYWMWDPKECIVMHSLVIPRGVCVLAGGRYAGTKDADGNLIIEVSAQIDDTYWTIIQSPFMSKYARTTAFQQQLWLGQDTVSYRQNTTVEIYGTVFEHTDQNVLTRQ